MTQQISPIVLYVALDPEALEALHRYIQEDFFGDCSPLRRAQEAIRSTYRNTQSLVAMSNRLGVGKVGP